MNEFLKYVQVFKNNLYWWQETYSSNTSRDKVFNIKIRTFFDTNLVLMHLVSPIS